MKAKEEFLETTDWIEFNPQVWSPTSDDERMAAIIAYMTGDGSIAKRSQSYEKKNGHVSIYERTFTGAFYSNIKEDLELIANDCKRLNIGISATVTAKKNDGNRKDGYQFQIGKADCEKLVSLGCPSGKKTTAEFDVPEWVMNGSLEVKRAYVAALFGAEGTMPAKDSASKSRFPRQPILTMCKIEGMATGEKYFNQLKVLLDDFGVDSSIGFTLAEAFGKTYRTNWLRVSSGSANLIKFYENVGFVYCMQKAIEGWKWSKYLRAYASKAKYRKDTIISMRKDKQTYSSIGKELGLTHGAVWRMEKDINSGKDTTAGHSFPHYSEWIKERWLEDKKLLRLQVIGRKFHEDRQVVWNVSVSSPDHSYLLASGANNFNSFETMSGRVYYSFDRQEHVGNYPFDPKLPIWVGMDFNIDPMSTVIFQPQPSGELWIVDEIVMFGSNTEEVCKELDKRFWRHQNQIVIYPDPAGGQRQHARGETDLDILRESGFKRIKYRRKHPPVADRVNAVNRLLRAADGTVRLRIDAHCKYVINAFEQTIYKKGSRDVDKDAGVEHSADAAGYCIELEYPVRKIEVGGLSL
jgi:hypothetical protein